MTIQILILHVLTSFCDSIFYFEQSTFCVEFLSFQILQNGNFLLRLIWIDIDDTAMTILSNLNVYFESFIGTFYCCLRFFKVVI